MSNKPFKFKQFIVEQDKVAMKVGTDGVLLGAWAPTAAAKTILDIGCGTGVIALMLAQRSQAMITAIDIDQSAFQQAQSNFNNSKWSDRLFAQACSLQEFQLKNQKQFDLIVSNPPYFTADKSDSSRATARSQTQLKLKTLVELSRKMLSENGKLCCIIPFEQQQKFLTYGSEVGLYPYKICEIKGRLGGKVKRIMLVFTRSPKDVISSELVIELENRHQYSTNYKNLLKDYLTIF